MWRHPYGETEQKTLLDLIITSIAYVVLPGDGTHLVEFAPRHPTYTASAMDSLDHFHTGPIRVKLIHEQKPTQTVANPTGSPWGNL